MKSPRFFPAVLTVLVIVGLLWLGGSAIYRSGWSQGFVMGQLAAKGDGATALPYMAYGSGFGPGLGSGVGFLGACLFAFFLFALAGLALKFIGFRRWAMTGHRNVPPDAEHIQRWAEHWSQHAGRKPWWWKDEGEQAPRSPAPATPSSPLDKASGDDTITV